MSITRFALIGTTALGLAACSGTTLEDNRNTVVGTGVGAAGGAILGGLIASDRDKGVRRGAVIGAAAGALLGNRLDQQEADLREQLDGSGAVIQNTGSELLVTLPEAITFDVDSTQVKPRFVASIRQLAANLQQYPNSMVSVVGHTDNTGSVAYNQTLSEGRASAVASTLIGAGVAPARITTAGEGEFSPVASNATAEGRRQNRRVVITITPTGA